MNTRLLSKRSQRGSTLVLLMIMVPLVLIPLVGLGIDATMAYIVQAKLQSAVDGAALGAGRLLGTGADLKAVGEQFFHLNFPDGYWGSKNVTCSVAPTTNLGTHTIDVTASVTLPLLFLRVMGKEAAAVAAAATATRRETRVVMVLDRSGSLNDNDPTTGSPAFPELRKSALRFVTKFRSGTDELGLVVFCGSGIVAYPSTRPYSTSVTGGGGPDTSWATASPSISTQITNLIAGGGTGMTEGMMLGYIEVQKAHYRDLAAKGYDTTLNAIVLFTDGVPNALAINPNDATYNAIKSGSTCTYTTETSDTSTQMFGYIVPGGNPTGWSSPTGLYRLSAYDTTYSLATWLASSAKDQTTSIPASAVATCTGMGYYNPTTKKTSYSLSSDMAKVPDQDIYGTSTAGTAYVNSSQSSYKTLSYDPTKLNTKNTTLPLAAWNAVDNVGKTIRSQTSMNQIIIYTIGYNPSNLGDAELLRRLANTMDATSYDASQPVGKSYQVTTSDQIDAAFQDVASELLRLSK